MVWGLLASTVMSPVECYHRTNSYANFNVYIVTNIVVKTLLQFMKYYACVINNISLYITVLLQMPNKPKGHAAMAASICIVCFRKPKTLRPISESVNGMIKSLILPEFQTDS